MNRGNIPEGATLPENAWHVRVAHSLCSFADTPRTGRPSGLPPLAPLVASGTESCRARDLTIQGLAWGSWPAEARRRAGHANVFGLSRQLMDQELDDLAAEYSATELEYADELHACVNGSLRHVHRNASGRHTLVSSEVANENDVLGPDATRKCELLAGMRPMISRRPLSSLFLGRSVRRRGGLDLPRRIDFAAPARRCTADESAHILHACRRRKGFTGLP